MVHGEEEATKALETAKSLFGGKGVDENMPTTELTSEDLTDGTIGILSLLVKTKLAPSMSEARRLVTQNGISIDDVKATDPKAQISIGDGIIVKKGKKVYHRVIVK
jgi:tyrosyl-tRNA synthetase